MASSRRRTLLQFGIPLALTGTFMLVDWRLHLLANEPWPDRPHLELSIILFVGSFLLLTTHFRSLAQRAETRALLAESEASYRTLFDMFPEATTVWSPDGILLLQNRASSRKLGGEPGDLVGKSVAEIFGPEGGRGYMDRLRQVYESGVPSEWEEEVLLPTGGQGIFWTFVQRVSQPGGSDAIQVVAYDITEKVRAERAANAEHERAGAYLKVAGALFLALDREGRVTLINERGCAVLGYAESEIVGRDWIGEFLAPHVRDQVRADYQRMLSELLSVEDLYVTPVLTRGGGERLIAWHGVLLRDDDGRPAGVLSSGEDITEKRRAEDALRAVEMLRVQELTALAERQRLARELHDSVSQALYGIALGVNTALAVLDRDREAARNALNYSISLARAGLSEMRALIFELRPESLASEGLSAALQKQAEAARARFEIPVNLEICSEPEVTLQVKEAVYRIAQEALHNAIKHAQAHEIAIQLDCSDASLTLIVQDDGVGFDPFGTHPGHLGLKSMRERAASFGGTLEITSAPGAGTLLQLRMPLGAAAAVTEAGVA